MANPIRYQSRIEKHATQLLALTGDDEEDEIDVQAHSSKSHESNVVSIRLRIHRCKSAQLARDNSIRRSITERDPFARSSDS